MKPSEGRYLFNLHDLGVEARVCFVLIVEKIFESGIDALEKKVNHFVVKKRHMLKSSSDCTMLFISPAYGTNTY